MAKRGVTGATLLLLAAALPTLEAQDRPGAEEAYFHAVGEYFEVPSGELAILRDWRLPPDEIPVVLFLAAHAGVSPEAIAALRRSSVSWAELVARYHVGVGALYVPVPDGAPVGGLVQVYERFRALPADRWSEIRLGDRDIVALVNVRLLAESLRVRPADVLRVADPSRSFVAIYSELLR